MSSVLNYIRNESSLSVLFSQQSTEKCVACMKTANHSIPYSNIDAYMQLCGHVLHYSCRASLYMSRGTVLRCPCCHPIVCVSDGCNAPITINNNNNSSALPLCRACIAQQTSWMVRRNNDPKALRTLINKGTQVSTSLVGCPTLCLVPVEEDKTNNNSNAYLNLEHQSQESTPRPGTACCSICLCSMATFGNFYLICGHKFHDSCIRTWIKKHRSCPICRAWV